MTKHERKARLYYASGCSCEQSIFGAFADVLGVSPVKAMQMAPLKRSRSGKCGAWRAAERLIQASAEGARGMENSKPETDLVLIERFGSMDCGEIQMKMRKTGCADVIGIVAQWVEKTLSYCW